jgi:flagellar basal-body rod modification protein FlgD
MTEIAPVSDRRLPAAGPAGNPASPLNSDFSTFLRMLTTQLKNQDPMNPMDNSEFAVQLATFSGVEQQVKTNTLLEALQAQLGYGNLAQFAGWVGKEARAPINVSYAGTPVTVYAKADAKATAAELVARDAGGQIVSRQAVATGDSSHAWSGTDPNGKVLPAGSYSVTLESLADGKPLASTPVESFARVTEVRTGPNGPMVVFAGGAEAAASSVTALRGG